MADEAIRFNSSLNTTGFDSGAKQLQSIAAQASAGVARHFTKLAGAVVGIGAAFLGVRAAVESFNAAVAMGGQLNDLSARTGETAGNLAILQRAFENAGAGAESVGPTINRLQRAIVEAGQGGKEQAEAFAKLGINLSEIKNLTPTEQLQAIAKALQNVGNDSDRTAIAMQLLGRSGGELIPLLRAMGSELDIARGQLGSTPAVMDRVAGALDTLGDNFNAIGHKGKEFAAGLLERAAPALVEITNRIANIDAAGLGAKLSEYAVSTGQWIAETLKLNEALKNIEIAVKGITSGNFGEGFKLMFLTARDTAFNVINQIVAAAQAAISTVSDAAATMFDANGALITLLKSSFSIAANYFKEVLYSALADFMDAIGRSGMADTFRYQAETAARSIETLTFSIGAQVEEVGHQAKEAFGGIPQAFKDSYAANMKDPLIDMTERTKETAAQAEKVAAATRAAAFNAQTFAENMANARNAMLEGGDISPFGSSPGMGENDKGFKFPWQGSGPSGPKIDIPATAPDGKSGKADKPQTALDQLRQRAENDPSAASQLSRIMRDQMAAEDRAASQRDMGAFFSAASTEQRARDRAERRANERNSRDFAMDLYGAKTYGEAFNRFRENSLQEGFMGLTEQDFKDYIRVMREQSQTPAERKAEADRSAAGGAGGGNAVKLDSTQAILSFLQSTFDDFKERLPQTVMA
jgi:hypothetical protein